MENQHGREKHWWLENLQSRSQVSRSRAVSHLQSGVEEAPSEWECCYGLGARTNAIGNASASTAVVDASIDA
jgi:hypothetical protein